MSTTPQSAKLVVLHSSNEVDGLTAEDILAEASLVIEDFGLEGVSPEELVSEDDPHAMRDLIVQRAEKKFVEAQAAAEAQKQAKIAEARAKLMAELAPPAPEPTADETEVDTTTTEAVEPEPVVMTDEDLRAKYPLMPSIVLLPEEDEYRLLNAMLVIWVLKIQIKAINREKRELLAARATEAMRQWKVQQRDVITCLEQVKAYVEDVHGKNPNGFHPRADETGRKQTERIMRENAVDRWVFKTYLTPEILRYQDLDRDEREIAEARESDIRTWCREQLGDEGKVANAVDQAITAVPAANFVFQDADRLIRARQVILLDVEVALGRKTRAQADAEMPAKPKQAKPVVDESTPTPQERVRDMAIERLIEGGMDEKTAHGRVVGLMGRYQDDFSDEMEEKAIRSLAGRIVRAAKTVKPTVRVLKPKRAKQPENQGGKGKNKKNKQDRKNKAAQAQA